MYMLYIYIYIYIFRFIIIHYMCLDLLWALFLAPYPGTEV
jgi:hypothetical protein